jgi:dinuclear metal center YbgI/SA1388 family protein
LFLSLQQISKGVKIKELIGALERFAPLPLQDGFDNAGLQVGLTEADVSGALLCLDVTEEVLQEAFRQHCNVVVAHHPLLFHALHAVTDSDLPQRCVRYAIQHDLTLYAAHTNLDNAVGGVNYKIAEKLGLENLHFLQTRSVQVGSETVNGGSGLVGEMSEPLQARDFVQQVKQIFEVECAMCNKLIERPVRRVALCGGAGDFLLPDAIKAGADAFLTGEMHYHDYFGHDDEIQIVVIGHYQSEQYTKEIFYSIIREACPDVRLIFTTVNTNPINYL